MAADENQPKRTEVHETKSPEGETVERKVTTEETHEEQPHETKASNHTIVARVIYYIGGAVMALLAVRLILALLGANRGNPFADFIFDLSAVFAWPFFGLFSYEPQYGVSTLELGTVVAIIIYGLLTVGIAQLVTLTRR